MSWNAYATPRNLSAKLAGEIKLEAAIPSLVKLLAPPIGEYFQAFAINSRNPHTPDGLALAPSTEALILIGLPAESALDAALADFKKMLDDNAGHKTTKRYAAALIGSSNSKYIIDKITHHQANQ